MPIYEFYCPDCHTIFNFFSRRVNTTKRPLCPRCKKKKLQREISLFATTGRAKETDDALGDLPIDPNKMEGAVEALAHEADGINEDDPKQAANLMRKFSKMTGMELGPGMQEALARLEKGEDPDAIEAELGDRLEKEDPFLMTGKKGKHPRRLPPARDETLYDL